MIYQRIMTGVTILLSDGEHLFGDIIEDKDGDIVLKTKAGEVFRIPRGAISRITEVKA